MKKDESPKIPQWCVDAADEIEAVCDATTGRKARCISAIIARHAPQQPQRPKPLRDIALEHGFDLTKVKEQDEVVDVMTGKNNSQQPQPASDPADELAKQSEEIGLYESTTPERPYACDENHGSYLDEPTPGDKAALPNEPTQRDVEAVNRYTVGPYGWTICKDGSGDYVTAADHDRIIKERDAELDYLRRLKAAFEESVKVRSVLRQRAERAEAEVAGIREEDEKLTQLYAEACRRAERAEAEVATFKAIRDAARKHLGDKTLGDVTREVLVKCAFVCGEISHGRAAELMDCSVQEWREKCYEEGIVQGDGLDETICAVTRREELQAQLAAANARVKELEVILKASCTDAAEDDAAIREMLRPHLTPYEVDGDSWGVPSLPTVVASFMKAMAKRHAALSQPETGVGE